MPESKSLSGTFSGTGVSDEVFVSRSHFNASVWGFGTATVELQRSFDGGVTWLTAKTFTKDFEGMGPEIETRVRYRFECTAYTSGPIGYRLGINLI